MTTSAALEPLRQRAVALRDVLTGVALSWGTRSDLEAAQGKVFDAVQRVAEWCALEADDTRFLERLSGIDSGHAELLAWIDEWLERRLR